MTAGAIPAASQTRPIVAPTNKIAFVDEDTRLLSNVGISFLKQLQSYLTGISRTMPCSCTSALNVYTLTLTPGGPAMIGYFDYEVWPFVADATSTGTITATVVPNGPAAGSVLPTLPVYKNNGGTAAGAGDITISRQYTFTYVDSLNSGAGGFVLR